MICPLRSEETIDIVLDYPTGRLDRARAASFEEHMAVCAECSAFLAGQNEVWKALDGWKPEAVSIDFNRRMWQKIDAAAAAPWYRKLADSLRMGAWKPALPLAAAVLLVATAFVMDHRPSVSVTPGVAGNAGVSISEADQVEKTLDDIMLLRQVDAAAGNLPNNSKTM
jgi:hypothetical protein